MIKFPDFKNLKSGKKLISVITCYDYAAAKIAAQSDIDWLLVGDSVAMVMHGFDNTIFASLEMMVMHTQAVARGATNKFIIADLPFLSYRKDLTTSMNAVEKLIQAGAHAVKLEQATGNLNLIQHIVESGIPVIGHLGLTPQYLYQLGGFKVQGRNEIAANQIFENAQKLEQAGCSAIVLECVPPQLAERITQHCEIPIIGIGAGAKVDGQVLVWHDVMGLYQGKIPKFAKVYQPGHQQTLEILNRFDAEVKSLAFPLQEHCYA